MRARPLNQSSGMPQMRAAFSGWFKPITLVRVTDVNTNGFITKQETMFTFKGTVQPLSAEEIQLKPEGQRAFQWLQIHALKSPNNLLVDDRIVFNGVRYKIMQIRDYSLNNYIEYHAIWDYQDE